MADPLPDKPKSGKGWVTVLCVGLLFVILAGFAMPGHGPKKAGCQLENAEQIYQIATAASAYRSDHQRFPERLSELVPDYVPTTDVFYFRCPYGGAFVPPDADKDPKLIDVFSPYELRTFGDEGAVVFERVPLWSDGKIDFCLIRRKYSYSAAVGPDPLSSISRITREEFASRYRKLFQP
jgi:hypothetical protein